MPNKCYSVRLVSLVSISDKAYKAIAFDGSEAIIPKSQVFGMDFSVDKCEAYWISAWILEQKTLQYSTKKEAFFSKNRKMMPHYIVEKHTPLKINPVDNNNIDELTK